MHSALAAALDPSAVLVGVKLGAAVLLGGFTLSIPVVAFRRIAGS